MELSAPQPVPAFEQPSFRTADAVALRLREAKSQSNICAGGRTACAYLCTFCDPIFYLLFEVKDQPSRRCLTLNLEHFCRYRGGALSTREPSFAACFGRCIVGPPIMAGLTPSPDISPVSAATTNGLFPRDSFCLNLSTLPDASNFMLKSALRSPHLLESPNGLFFGGTGLNSYRKRPRNMSQSSGTDREMSTNGTPPATSQTGSTAPVNTNSNGTNSEQRPPNKKRPSTDTIDYPRRRATIAVLQLNSLYLLTTDGCSARYAGPGNQDAMARGQNAGSVQSSTQNASTGSLGSSWTLATN